MFLGFERFEEGLGLVVDGGREGLGRAVGLDA
jgi:hypothetical protein